MRTLFLFILIASITAVLSGAAEAAVTAEVKAYQGKAADWRNPGTVMGNTTQLMTRSAAGDDCKKSWLQFDLAELYAENPAIQGNILDAKLTFYGAKSEGSAKSYALYGLNDGTGLEDWEASALTWNNGPGNDINHGTAVLAALTTSLYTASIPVPVLDVMSETPEANRAALTAYLNTDTDGKITLIFTAGGTCYLWNVGEPLEPVLTITYNLGQNTKKAHFPVPADDAVVGTDVTSLSWTNPDPNDGISDIVCDVYLGTEPNRPDMVKVELGANISSVNISQFQGFAGISDETTYYWIVDCTDTGQPEPNNLIPGEAWSFDALDNDPPAVDAGADQVAWLENGTVTVNLDASVSDDGGTPTVLWEQVDDGAPTSPAIASPNAVDTSITITERGDYTFKLTADDGFWQVPDTLRIVVGNDACDASHLDSGEPYPAGDMNEDCIVDLLDLHEFAAAWLNCTDGLANCAD